MMMNGWERGYKEITTKHGTVVLAKSAIEEFFVANPTIKGRLKSLDESDAAAARDIFHSWLKDRGAINLPSNNNKGQSVCIWYGDTGRKNSTERGTHVACSTMPFRVLLVGTATVAGLGKEQRELFDKASKEASDAADELKEETKRAAGGEPAGVHIRISEMSGRNVRFGTL
ncbi:hypothetical protein T492DRAFT_1127903 [Pavlovales sp. CCMP2436]|nr:hypothetical protein T492DRAFT_1127903 [Pavlovales sp. CCMP2436]